jgi:hypothetical protein
MAKCCPWGRVRIMGEIVWNAAVTVKGSKPNKRIMNKRVNRKIAKEKIK